MFEKKTLQNIYMIFSQVFSSRSFTWAIIGKTLIEIESAVAKETKNVRFCSIQNILQAAFFYHRERDI